MADALDPTTIRDTILAGLKGGPPPADLLERSGGWPALEALAATLTDDPLLTPMMSLLARDATVVADNEEDFHVAASAAAAMAHAVLGSTDLLQFTQGLETVCATPVLVKLVGRDVADTCLALAGPPIPAEGAVGPEEHVVARHAVALETATRLALQGSASTYKVIGIFDDVREPQPLRYARAVTRSVTCAFDYWSPEAEVADVIDILTGVTKPTTGSAVDGDGLARHEQYRLDIASDALWAKANIEVAQALRSATAADMEAKLLGALAVLDQVADLDDRADVDLLRVALRLLVRLLPSLGAAAGGPVPTGDWDLVVFEVESLAERTAELTFDMQGIGHWSGDRKMAVLQGWARLVRDLGWLRDQLDRDSLYDAAVVLDDLVEIYVTSRAYDVGGGAPGSERVMEVVRPAIASGVAAKAGLVRNLSDHVAHLQLRIAEAGETGESATVWEGKVATAQIVLAATRASLQVAPEPPGKSDEQAADVPALLVELFPTDVLQAVEGVEGSSLLELAADLADLKAQTGLDSDLIVTQVRKAMLEAVSTCDDFRDGVSVAVTQVLDQLIRFVSRRMNTQKSYKAYLYDENSKEKPLQDDLCDWLSQGHLAGMTSMEVQEVAGGRVDIQLQFPGFRIYLELKADSTRVPVEEKAAYIRQAATYQATSVAIGFLIVLRTKAAKDKALPQHLRDYVTHTTLPIDGSAIDRHVIMLEVPGGRTAPSAS